MEITFSKIVNNSVFTSDYNPFLKNNMISFPKTEKIAVVYGPNGTGKTSLINVLSDIEKSEIEFTVNGKKYEHGSGFFHIINDQNSRNIIHGEARDFLVGDEIQREYELSEKVKKGRQDFLSSFIGILKSEFRISAAKSLLINQIKNDDLRKLVQDCSNSKSKGERYTTEQLLDIICKLKKEPINCTVDESKFAFWCDDLSSTDSVISKVKSLLHKNINANNKIAEIEQNTEAVKILTKYKSSKCIVCDTDNIDSEILLERKKTIKEETLQSLDSDVRKLITQLLTFIPEKDPFYIKDTLILALSSADTVSIQNLCSLFDEYQSIFSIQLNNRVCELRDGGSFEKDFIEYNYLVSKQAVISDEDLLFIQEIINGSMDKILEVKRDSNKHLRILLSDKDFLEIGRENLPLSSGEQNFLSLTMEFLKAKNSPEPVVVIDDPVSSFDSIYKNKVAFAIIRTLQGKYRIILTHNVDLVRLLEHQYKNCFKLFLMNNTEGEENGFIELNSTERDMLISLESLLQAFRMTVPNNIKDNKLFYISMIPFMRGYANIIGDKGVFEKLTAVMHGYMNEKVDIESIYIQLFGQPKVKSGGFDVCVQDILNETIDGKEIIDKEKFPLLNKTLCHSFTYLFLRLMIEKALVNKFGIDTRKNEQLGDIINVAFPGKDITSVKNRIRLTSKKTLLNEFNHFEGNLSIFQPAIDITEQALGKERTDLISFVRDVL